MICYGAALELYTHDKFNCSLPKFFKKKMASRANNTDLFCAQALVKKSIKLHRKRKSKKLCYFMHVLLFEGGGFTSLKQQKYGASYIHTHTYIYILGCDYKHKVLSSKAKASSINFELQNLQDTKLNFACSFPQL